MRDMPRFAPRDAGDWRAGCLKFIGINQLLIAIDK